MAMKIGQKPSSISGKEGFTPPQSVHYASLVLSGCDLQNATPTYDCTYISPDGFFFSTPDSLLFERFTGRWAVAG